MSGALPAIGTVGGAVLGGPVGAAIGGGLGSLLGGNSGAGTSKQSSRPVDLTLPWFSQLGQNVAGNLGGFISGGPAGATPYSGQLTAGLTQREGAGLGVLQQAALDPTRLGLIQNTLAGNYLPGSPGGNPFLDAAIQAAQRPTAEALQYAVGRQIPGMFAAAGQQVGQGVGRGGSTAKDLNVIRAAETGGRALGDIATNMSNANYQFERGLQQGAIGLGQQDIGAMIANIQAQGIPRAIEDQGITRAIALGQQGIGNWLQGLQIAQALPLQTTGNVSQGTAVGAQPNLLTGLFGTQGAIPGLNAALAPTINQGGTQVPNPTIFNTPGFNPFHGIFG